MAAGETGQVYTYMYNATGRSHTHTHAHAGASRCEIYNGEDVVSNERIC